MNFYILFDFIQILLHALIYLNLWKINNFGPNGK